MSSGAGSQRRGPVAHPSEIGGYEIVGPFGRGGMGVVYRARDPQTGASVALIVPVSNRTTSTQVTERRGAPRSLLTF